MKSLHSQYAGYLPHHRISGNGGNRHSQQRRPGSGRRRSPVRGATGSIEIDTPKSTSTFAKVLAAYGCPIQSIARPNSHTSGPPGSRETALQKARRPLVDPLTTFRCSCGPRPRTTSRSRSSPQQAPTGLSRRSGRHHDGPGRSADAWYGNGTVVARDSTRRWDHAAAATRP